MSSHPGPFKSFQAGHAAYLALDVAQMCEALRPGAYPRLPYSLRVLAENIGRCEPDETIRRQALVALLDHSREIDLPYRPARIVMQDLLGTPALVDLAGLRDAVAEQGGDPRRVKPAVPVHMVIDHSLNVDHWAEKNAGDKNIALERSRNAERFEFFSWCNRAFENLTVIPSGNGILHQINLERLTPVVASTRVGRDLLAFPDTLVGTDSHTPMINALGVFGWGVGGIEAEAAMLGKPLMLRLPETVGVRLEGRISPGILATDVVLSLTHTLRQAGVVGTFIEFFGPGLAQLSLPDRATVSNMTPEFGATMALFPIDERSIEYLQATARSAQNCALVRAYAQAQGLWHDAFAQAEYDRVITIDLGSIDQAIAGPKHPHQRIPVHSQPAAAAPRPGVSPEPAPAKLPAGAVVIAAITACTNTSNPRAVIAAALLARRARQRGLRSSPWTKTSFAPGSRVVADYLARAGLNDDLDALGFEIVGFGCTTCCGMSGPLGPIGERISREKTSTAAVLSGNRNFEGRIHPLVHEAFIMSPPLVVAYAIAGSVRTNIQQDPLGHDQHGQPVFLRDIWPSDAEIDATAAEFVTAELFSKSYARIPDAFTPNQTGSREVSPLYAWQPASTYIRRPPYWAEGFRLDPAGGLTGLRPLAILGDHITTDHLSPSGAILPESEAGSYLLGQGVTVEDFNSYGTRRGNHEVGMRSSFASPRLRNELLADRTGPFTQLLPDGGELSIFAAAQVYAQRRQPLIVIAGKEYGSGSSRDWAAKGPRLLGVRVVLAESFERIHRSNLAGMGVLPLEFAPGETRGFLRLTGRETYDVLNLADLTAPGTQVTVRINRADGSSLEIRTLSRLDTSEEVGFFRHGGLLPQLLGEFLQAPPQSATLSS